MNGMKGDVIMSDIAKRIFELLDSRGIEQQELAEYLGLKKQSISEWRAGRTHSYKKYINQIAEFFGVSTDYLLNTENMSSSNSDEDIWRDLLKTFSMDELKLLSQLSRDEASEVVRAVNESSHLL